MTEGDFDTKAQFLEAVREDGAVLGELEYFTNGDGNATSYKARTDDGEVVDVKKSDVEAAWNETQGESSDNDGDDEPEEIHLGTFYYASGWEEDDHRETLEDLLEEAGWYIDGEVSSGGYRISTVED